MATLAQVSPETDQVLRKIGLRPSSNGAYTYPVEWYKLTAPEQARLTELGIKSVPLAVGRYQLNLPNKSKVTLVIAPTRQHVESSATITSLTGEVLRWMGFSVRANVYQKIGTYAPVINKLKGVCLGKGWHAGEAAAGGGVNEFVWGRNPSVKLVFRNNTVAMIDARPKPTVALARIATPARVPARRPTPMRERASDNAALERKFEELSGEIRSLAANGQEQLKLLQQIVARGPGEGGDQTLRLKVELPGMVSSGGGDAPPAPLARPMRQIIHRDPSTNLITEIEQVPMDETAGAYEDQEDLGAPGGPLIDAQ